MRKRSVLAALVAGGVSLGAFTGVQADTAPAGGGEGCVAYSHVPAGPPAGNIVYSAACNFVATRKGGYATAAQSWSVKVWASKQAKLQNAAPIKDVGSTKGSKPCGVASFFEPGNYIEVIAGSGVAAAGNPFPSGSPDTTSDSCTNLP